MSKRKTEQERRAELAAKIARIDERAARKASEEVRALESLRRAVVDFRAGTASEVNARADMLAVIDARLPSARTAALAAQESAK